MEATATRVHQLRQCLGLDVELPSLEPCRTGWRYGQLGADKECLLVIGAFDGVHTGHKDLIAHGARYAKERQLPLVILTFDPDPSVVLGVPQALLLSAEDRLRQLWALGPQELRVCSFTPELASLSPEEFLERAVFGDGLRPRVILVGEGFSLGAHGKGTVSYLSQLGAAKGFEVIAQPLLELQGAPVSATRIRRLLEEGDTLQAATLLGRQPFVGGTVMHGRGQGTSFGFPTANVLCAPGLALPTSGVFAAFGVLDQVAWPAAVNLGTPPTFDAQEPKSAQGFLEATLLGFSQDIYGAALNVVLYERLRPSRPFSSQEELIATVHANIKQVCQEFGDEPLRLDARL